MQVEVHTDWAVGSRLTVSAFHHARFVNSGTVLQFEPPQVLRYNLLSSLSRLPDKPENYTVFELKLVPVDQGTSLTVTVSGFPTESIFKHLHFYWRDTMGVIKNLIDWTSRFRPQPFDGRHGLLLSASPSMVGGNRGLWALRMPFEHLGARIFPDMFSLAMAHKALAGDELADPALNARFEKTVQSFLSLAEAAKHYPCMKRAWVEFLGEPPGGGAERVDPVPS
jgi:hypothetical protein